MSAAKNNDLKARFFIAEERYLLTLCQQQRRNAPFLKLAKEDLQCLILPRLIDHTRRFHLIKFFVVVCQNRMLTDQTQFFGNVPQCANILDRKPERQ